MKKRIRKKIDKADALYYHSDKYTFRQVMESYYWWLKYLRKKGKSNMKKINLNDCVYVAITEEGFDYLRIFQGSKYVKLLKKNVVTIDGKEYHKMQLYNVMNLFGNAMYLGHKLVIETDILMEEKQ